MHKKVRLDFCYAVYILLINFIFQLRNKH